MPDMTITQQVQIDWTSVEKPPEKSGDYLCAVDTDYGQETHVLNWDGKRWIHEGEPTFCHGYYFKPYAWSGPIAPPARDQFVSDDD